MQLYHNGLLVGALENHFHETPWSSAKLIAADPAVAARLVRICAFQAWCEAAPDTLAKDEDDRRYRDELAARCLDEAMLDAYWGEWLVQLPSGERRSVSPPQFEDDGYVTWRW
jgi:hypothetical protein